MFKNPMRGLMAALFASAMSTRTASGSNTLTPADNRAGRSTSRINGYANGDVYNPTRIAAAKRRNHRQSKASRG